MLQLMRDRITATTDSGTAVDVVMPALKPGQQARLTHIAVANASGESVTVLLGITQSGSFLQVWAKQTVADADAFGALVDLALGEGDSLTARVTGSAKSGPVTLFVNGTLNNPC